MTVDGLGTLTLEDIGWTPQGAWGVRVNGVPDSVWLYQGNGQANIAVSGTGEVSISGTDMHTTLVALPNGRAGSQSHTNDDYLNAAQRFAPIVTFYQDGDEGSQERYYPCSIEFLLAHSTLRRGGLTDYTGNNTSAPPGLVYFPTPQGNYHIFSRDPNGTGIIHLVSGDGLNGWGAAQGDNVNSNTSSGVSAIVFDHKMHLFYRDPTGNGIYHRVSSDGFDWSGGPGWYFGLDCDGTPKAVATPTCIYLVACDAGGNGIMWAKSTDGVNFSHGYTGYNTNNWVSPGVAWYRDQFHVFFLDHDQDFEAGFKKHVGILHITSPTGDPNTWSRAASWYAGADASNGPEAVATSDRLHLFFRDPTGNGIYHREATTGDDWGPIDYIGIDCEGKPSAIAVGDDLFVTSQDGGGRGVMVAMVSDFAPIEHPTQDDLVQHNDEYFHLDVDPSANAGEITDTGEITAPMYVTVQTGTDETGAYVDITYMMLYAFQGGQPLQVIGVGNVIVENYGMHQADLEWVTVRLDPTLTRIQKVGYEAHGNIVHDEDSGGWWPNDPDPSTGATYERDGERPIVRVARNGHACRNGWLAEGTGNPIIVHFLKDAGQKDILWAIELHSTLPTCPTWRPWEKPGGLVPLGVLPRQADEPPVSVNQPWAVYAGRLGKQQSNPFESATYVNGQHLSAGDWAIVKGLETGAQLIGALSSAKIAAEVLNGIGPFGPGNRDFAVNSALTPIQQPTSAAPTPRQPDAHQQAAPAPAQG